MRTQKNLEKSENIKTQNQGFIYTFVRFCLYIFVFPYIAYLLLFAVLGVVGVPMFDDFYAKAQVSHVKEKHDNAYKLISRSIKQCSGSNNKIKFKDTSGKLITVNCYANNISKGFVDYFNSTDWKNPYSKNKCCSVSRKSPLRGATHIYTMDGSILIKSNSFENDKDSFITNVVTFK